MNTININRIKITNKIPHIRVNLPGKLINNQIKLLNIYPNIANMVNSSIKINNIFIKTLQPILSIIGRYRSKAIANLPSSDADKDQDKDGTAIMTENDYNTVNSYLNKNPIFISGFSSSSDQDIPKLFNHFPERSYGCEQQYCYKEIDLTILYNAFESFNDLLNFANKNSQTCFSTIYQDQTSTINIINQIMNSQHMAWKRTFNK